MANTPQGRSASPSRRAETAVAAAMPAGLLAALAVSSLLGGSIVLGLIVVGGIAAALGVAIELRKRLRPIPELERFVYTEGSVDVRRKAQRPLREGERAGAAGRAAGLNNQAIAERAQGSARRAANLLLEALRIEEEAYGPSDQRLVATLTNLGNALSDLGEVTAAAQAYERALGICSEADLGNSENATLASRLLAYLASIRASQGEYQEALFLSERAMGSAQLLGDPKVIAEIANLRGGIAYRAGEIGLASRIFESLLPQAEAEVVEPRLAAAIFVNFGLVLRASGRFAAARRMMETGLAREIEVRGVDHPDVLETEGTLGSLLLDMGRLGDAEQMLDRVLAQLRASSEPDAEAFVRTLVSLAGTARAYDESGRAVGLLEEALSLSEATELPRLSVTVRAALANALRDAGRLEQAAAHAEAALAKLRALGVSVSIARQLNNLALIDVAHGDHRAALRHLEEAVALEERLLGRDHPEHARSVANLAIVLALSERWKPAERTMREAWRLIKARGERGNYRVTIGVAMAQIYAARGHFLRARWLISSLKDDLAALDPGHPDLQRVLVLSELLDQHRLFRRATKALAATAREQIDLRLLELAVDPL